MRAGTWPVLAATGRTTRLPFTAPPTLLTAHEPLSPEFATPASGPACHSPTSGLGVAPALRGRLHRHRPRRAGCARLPRRESPTRPGRLLLVSLPAGCHALRTKPSQPPQSYLFLVACVTPGLRTGAVWGAHAGDGRRNSQGKGLHSRARAPRPWLPRAPPAGDPLANSSFYPLFGPSAKRQFCAVSDLPSFQFYYLCIRCLSDFSTEETNIYLSEARPPIRPAQTPSPTPQGSRLLLQQPCDPGGGGLLMMVAMLKLQYQQLTARGALGGPDTPVRPPRVFTPSRDAQDAARWAMPFFSF